MNILKSIKDCFNYWLDHDQNAGKYNLEVKRRWDEFKKEDMKLQVGWTYVDFDAEMALQTWRTENPDYAPDDVPPVEYFHAQAAKAGLLPSIIQPGKFIRPPQLDTTNSTSVR